MVDLKKTHKDSEIVKDVIALTESEFKIIECKYQRNSFTAIDIFYLLLYFIFHY
jgi:Holliday junction resolvase